MSEGKPLQKTRETPFDEGVRIAKERLKAEETAQNISSMSHTTLDTVIFQGGTVSAALEKALEKGGTTVEDYKKKLEQQNPSSAASPKESIKSKKPEAPIQSENVLQKHIPSSDEAINRLVELHFGIKPLSVSDLSSVEKKMYGKLPPGKKDSFLINIAELRKRKEDRGKGKKSLVSAEKRQNNKSPGDKKVVEGQSLSHATVVETTTVQTNPTAESKENILTHIQAVKAHLNALEHQVTHPAEHIRTHDQIENDVLGAERDLRTLESSLPPKEDLTLSEGREKLRKLIEDNFSNPSNRIHFSRDKKEIETLRERMATQGTTETNSSLPTTKSEDKAPYDLSNGVVELVNKGGTHPDVIKGMTPGQIKRHEEDIKEIRDKYNKEEKNESKIDKRDFISLNAERNKLETLNKNLKIRAEELNKKVEKIGLEGHFRKLGEKYAKIDWKQKLGVGLALGIGAATFSVVSVPAALACMSGLFAQRVAGMAHAYIGAEKFLKFNAEKRDKSSVAQFIDKKEVAILGAALYSIGMGAGISYAVKEVSQYIGDITGFNLDELKTFAGHIKEDSAEYTKAMSGWLKNHWPFNHPGVPSQAANEFKITPLPIEKAPDADVLVAHEKVIPPPVSATIENNPEGVSGGSTPEMPSIGATKGYGYEYMLKQLWERLHEQGVKIPEDADANNSYPNSDLVKLLAADKDSIDKVVHQIASQAGHGFNVNGSSIIIGLDTVMTIDADGMIRVDNAPDSISAPAESTGEVSKNEFSNKDGFADYEKIKDPLNDMNKVPVQHLATVPAESSHSVSKSIEELFKSNQEFENLGKHAPVADSVQGVPEADKSFENATPMTPEKIHHSSANPVVEKHISPMHPMAAQINAHGLPVSIDSVGSYVDSDGRHVVFGGSAAERVEAAKALVEKNHDTEVYFNSGDKDGHLKKVFFDPGSSWSLNPMPSEIRIIETADNPIRPDNLTEQYNPTDISKNNYNTGDTTNSTFYSVSENQPVVSTAEAPMSEVDYVMTEHKDLFVNSNKIPIDPLHGHIFQDKSGAVYAYGNDRLDAAQEYAKSHPNTSVWVQADKSVLFDGKLRPYVLEVKYGGFWKGMQIFGADGPANSSQIGGIDPENFTKQLDTSTPAEIKPDESVVSALEKESPVSEIKTPEKIDSVNEKVPDGQGIQKEKVVSVPDKSPVSNINHKYDIINTNSLQGKFEYSPDGKSIQSVSFESSGTRETGEKLLVNNYVEILNEKQVNPLVQQSVLGRAINVSQHLNALHVLEKEGASQTPQADYLRKIIKKIVNRDIKLFGPIFRSDIIKSIK